MFIVALYLPWCSSIFLPMLLFSPQLYADNLKCLSRDPDLLLHAARLTTRYVRLVGQEPAPSKCVILSTSREVRKGMKDWVLSCEGAVNLMSEIWVGIWTLPFVGGLRLLLLGFVWSFPG